MSDQKDDPAGTLFFGVNALPGKLGLGTSYDGSSARLTPETWARAVQYERERQRHPLPPQPHEYLVSAARFDELVRDGMIDKDGKWL
jgi:hypothetical protein